MFLATRLSVARTYLLRFALLVPLPEVDAAHPVTTVHVKPHVTFWDVHKLRQVVERLVYLCKEDRRRDWCTLLKTHVAKR